jgi:hypothetical protein
MRNFDEETPWKAHTRKIEMGYNIKNLCTGRMFQSQLISTKYT